jgi:DNA primase large subunit
VFAKVALSDFMQANTREDFLKLVNVALENGTVFLDRSAFVRFLSELAARRVTTSLPVPLKEVPSSLIAVAGQLKSQLAARQKAEFDLKSLGVVEADAFPPCMAKMYSELLSGKNANHAARFNLATFLAAVGMPLDQMVDVYRHAPNFDEKVTRYQLGKIAGKGKQRYSPSSCAKMREYELCVANCPVSHPIQFYRRAKGSAPLPKEADGADAAMPSDASSAPTAVEGS